MADERAALDQLIAQVESRLAALLAPFVADLTRRVSRSSGRGGTVGLVGREALSRWLPGALADLFGASPADADRLYTASGTVPHLLAASLRTSVRVAVAPVVTDVARQLAGQPSILAAVTGPSANPRPPLFDPARVWVDPAGHRLSDRIWLSSEDLRSRIDGLLDYHIGRGTSSVDIGRELEIYLSYGGRINGRGEQVVTRTPYGQSGLARPRTLARTEISRVYNAASAQAGALNPFVSAMGYRLSSSHPMVDICDGYANADKDGLGKGNYKFSTFPTPPVHPNCLCYATPVVRQDTDRVLAELARKVQGESVSGMDDVGSMPLGTKYLTAAITGFDTPQSGS